MNFVIKKIVPLLFLSITIHAQDSLEIQFNFAKSLYDSEKYFDAITEFKRLNFFDQQNQYEFKSNFFIGYSYKNGGKFSDAIMYFRKAELLANNEEDFFNSKIEIIKSNILRRTCDRALRLLDDLDKDDKYSGRSEEINYWRGWALMFSNQWEEAASKFNQLGNQKELAELCKSVSDDLYSAVFAKYSSMILPGAGQFYTGEYLSGFLSLAWNVFAGYLTIDSFLEDRVFDGIITANFLWFRFYRGNFQNAEKFANAKNIDRINEAMLYLMNTYKGQKP